ncbi:hypothetical protein FACS1894120_4540 [Clostridia bacterium]|nr:hypothetical protein FACS1894120_4540 [Clostridia bacterium]
MKTNNEISVAVSYINLGGIGFTAEPESMLEKRKTYTLRLKAVSDLGIIEFDVKIMIIKISDCDNDRQTCSAGYRNLTDKQVVCLEAISESFGTDFSKRYGIDFADSGKLQAVIVT